MDSRSQQTITHWIGSGQPQVVLSIIELKRFRVATTCNFVIVESVENVTLLLIETVENVSPLYLEEIILLKC